VRLRKAPVLAAFGALASLFAASPARAEASAWVFLGGGALAWKQQQNATYQSAGTMIIDAGVGTSPEAPVIVGGLLRIEPVLPGGADLQWLARIATHGFQAGDWGVAVDLGGFGRAWGSQSVGFAGSASLGMPLGITLMAQTELGIDHAFSFGGALGIDVLRLTIYRQTLLKWWQNPSPAYGPTAGGGGFRF
jgi:hypothetical protein